MARWIVECAVHVSQLCDPFLHLSIHNFLTLGAPNLFKETPVFTYLGMSINSYVQVFSVHIHVSMSICHTAIPYAYKRISMSCRYAYAYAWCIVYAYINADV